jgi:GTP-binding protein
LTFFDSPGLLDFTDELSYIEQIVKDSDVLLFLIDDTVGITAKEQHILQIIRTEKKQSQTILVINKLDVKRKEAETDLALSDYYGLGFTNIIGISAKTERNLGALRDLLLSHTKENSEGRKTITIETSSPFLQKEGTFAIIGKPNAGKSTLLNTLV